MTNKHLKITEGLTDIHFLDASGSRSSSDLQRIEFLEVPALPGGYLAGQFKFKSDLHFRQDLTEPTLDLAWRVTGDETSGWEDAEFVAGSDAERFPYVQVVKFDDKSGEGVALIKIPFMGNDEGFPPLLEGVNKVEIFVGLQGELNCDDQIEHAEYAFDPIKIVGVIPDYSIIVLNPSLNLQERCESEISVVAKSPSEEDRTITLDIEYGPANPGGVEIPKSITVPSKTRC